MPLCSLHIIYILLFSSVINLHYFPSSFPSLSLSHLPKCKHHFYTHPLNIRFLYLNYYWYTHTYIHIYVHTTLRSPIFFFLYVWFQDLLLTTNHSATFPWVNLIFLIHTLVTYLWSLFRTGILNKFALLCDIAIDIDIFPSLFLQSLTENMPQQNSWYSGF